MPTIFICQVFFIIYFFFFYRKLENINTLIRKLNESQEYIFSNNYCNPLAPPITITKTVSAYDFNKIKFIIYYVG